MSHGASLHHRSMAGSLYMSAPRSARRFAVARRAAGRETDTERQRGPEPDGRERREPSATRHHWNVEGSGLSGAPRGAGGCACGCGGERRVETAQRGAAPSTAGCHVTAAAPPTPSRDACVLYCKHRKKNAHWNRTKGRNQTLTGHGPQPRKAQRNRASLIHGIISNFQAKRDRVRRWPSGHLASHEAGCVASRRPCHRGPRSVRPCGVSAGRGAQDQERQLLDPTRRILPLESMYAMGGGLRVASA